MMRLLLFVLFAACLAACASDPAPQPTTVVGAPPAPAAASEQADDSVEPADVEPADTSECESKFGADPVDGATCLRDLSNKLFGTRDTSYVSLVAPSAIVTVQFAQPQGLRARQMTGAELQHELVRELRANNRSDAYFARLAQSAQNTEDVQYLKNEDGSVVVTQVVTLENGSVEELVRHVAMVDGKLRFTRYHSVVFTSGI